MFQKENNERRAGTTFKSALLALFSIVIVLIIISVFLISSGQTVRLLSLQQLNSLYNNSYTLTTPQNCQNSSLLQGLGIENACTVAFTIKSNNTSLPSAISLFYYSFNTNADAYAYINNITQYLNSTPWPLGVSTYANLTGTSNFTLYFTDINFQSPTPYRKVLSEYVLHGKTVIGVSSLIDQDISAPDAKNVTEELLYDQYSLLSSGSG